MKKKKSKNDMLNMAKKYLSEDEYRLYVWLKKHERESIEKIIKHNPEMGNGSIGVATSSVIEIKTAVLDIKNSLDTIKTSFITLLALFGIVGGAIAVSAIKFAFY